MTTILNAKNDKRSIHEELKSNIQYKKITSR